ncbi:alpha/beta hydrolase [Emticicia sp. BO119]|uniref:alpha/beta hydrolase n=1 Tax=Emticicia sp. BO119 TaxID=2757768 RepID=UPI0015EFF956|nr:alpha/beta hydrolase [Emticicia sp. BO119]MBA4848912.1 alpha/beta hydrolase [Emticicia sp. BO119]
MIIKLIHQTLLSLAVVVLGSTLVCGKNFENFFRQDTSYTRYLNLKYGPAEGNGNLLDLYLPRNNTTDTKLIVYVHGGSWKWGSKNDFPEILISTLTAKGYGVATINYRLLREGNNRFPAQIEDIKNAIAFLTAKANAYGYNGKEFALLGVSAGAHLSLLYTYKHDAQKQVRTVIDIVGPTDLTDKVFRDNPSASAIINQFLGNANPQAAIAIEASPIYHLKKETGVPTIIFHGESDELVNVNQSKELYKKLQLLGIQSQLELYPGETHEMRKSLFSIYTRLGVWLQKVYPAK